MGEVAFLFDGLFGQDVTFERMFAFDLPRPGQREALLGTGICLHLGHFFELFCVEMECEDRGKV